jgi:hypothetical protein
MRILIFRVGFANKHSISTIIILKHVPTQKGLNDINLNKEDGKNVSNHMKKMMMDTLLIVNGILI